MIYSFISLPFCPDPDRAKTCGSVRIRIRNPELIMISLILSYISGKSYLSYFPPPIATSVMWELISVFFISSEVPDEAEGASGREDSAAKEEDWAQPGARPRGGEKVAAARQFLLAIYEDLWSCAVEPGCLHGNSHLARQFRCFTRQFYNSNDNFTMKINYDNFFALIFRIPKLSLNMKSDQNSDLRNFLNQILLCKKWNLWEFI